MIKLYWNVRWWVYYNVSPKLAWAVEIKSCDYQTFFAFGSAHARQIADRRFGKNSYLLNREWM